MGHSLASAVMGRRECPLLVLEGQALRFSDKHLMKMKHCVFRLVVLNDVRVHNYYTSFFFPFVFSQREGQGSLV